MAEDFFSFIVYCSIFLLFIIFSIVTAMTITNFLHVEGVIWWIVFITLWGSLGLRKTVVDKVID